MKKFTIKMAYLILPITFLFLFIEYNLSKIENSYSFKKNNFEKKLDNIEVINLGSSHGNMGFDPDFYSYNGFNMANVSQSLYYDYKIFNKYKNEAKLLKVVILPISYFSFGFKLTDSEEYWREFFYNRFYNIPIENNSRSLDLRNYSLFALYGNKESASYILKRFNVNLAEDFKETGGLMEKNYSLNEFMNNISDYKGKLRVESHDKVFNKNNIQENLFYIESIIKECKEKNIIPIIVTTPTYKTYYENMNKDTWNLSLDKVNYLQKKYKIEYYNYLKDKRFQIEDFRDNDHLNPKGAEKFSKIINNEILKNHIKM